MLPPPPPKKTTKFITEKHVINYLFNFYIVCNVYDRIKELAANVQSHNNNTIDFKCDIDDQQLFNFTPYILKHISVASTPYILRTDSLL